MVSKAMDLRTLAGIVVALVALWAVLLVLFWALRPKGVSVREILGVIPDVIRLLRSVIGTGQRRWTFGSCWSDCWPGSCLPST
jgi:hypothetical membrane protein